MGLFRKAWIMWKEASAEAKAEVAQLDAAGYFDGYEVQSAYSYPKVEKPMFHDGFFEHKAAVQRELGARCYDPINQMTYHTPAGTAQRVYQGGIYKGIRV